MAPNTPARSRIHRAGWSHWYTGPLAYAVCYADGGDPAPANDDPGQDGDPAPADDGWAPPTREEWEAHQQKLRTASAEAANRRKWLKAAGYDPKSGQKLQPDPEPDDDDEPTPAKDEPTQPTGPSKAEVKRMVEKAAAEAELRGMRKTKSLVTGLNTALSEAGWNGSRLGSLMKLIDLDDVEVDDDGEITGLSEQIEDIKKEWPEFFKRTRVPASNQAGSGQNGSAGAKVDAADKRPPAPEPKGWAERLAGRAVRGEG